MPNVGSVRKIDDLGRIVLPIELRKVLGIKKHDEVAISLNGNTIMVEKFMHSCVFCGSNDNIQEFKNKLLCATCVTLLHDKNRKTLLAT